MTQISDCWEIHTLIRGDAGCDRGNKDNSNVSTLVVNVGPGNETGGYHRAITHIQHLPRPYGNWDTAERHGHFIQHFSRGKGKKRSEWYQVERPS